MSGADLAVPTDVMWVDRDLDGRSRCPAVQSADIRADDAGYAPPAFTEAALRRR